MFGGITRRGTHEEGRDGLMKPVVLGGGLGGTGKTDPLRPGVDPIRPMVALTGGGFQIKDDGFGGGSSTPILDNLFGDEGQSGVKLESGTDDTVGSDTETGAFMPWRETEEGKAAYDAYMKAYEAVNAHGTKFNFANQTELDEIKRQIQANPEFTFDLEGDALYQQYKDQYMRQGELAMKDTIGQAAALTGGYANSWAQSAGQQAYYGQLDQLNDKAIDLYQIAYDKHQDERDELYRQYSMLAGEKDDAYDKWVDERDRLIEVRDDAKSVYDEGESEYLDSLPSKKRLEYVADMPSTEIVETLKGFKDELTGVTDNNALYAFLYDLVAVGRLTEEQMTEYYLAYADEE